MFMETDKSERPARKDALSEGEMIERILDGESVYVQDLIKPYEIRARAIARRFLKHDQSRIEDVLQEAVMKAFTNLEKLRNKASFGSWFLTIVRNLSIDAVKRESCYIGNIISDTEWDLNSWIANTPDESSEPIETTNFVDLLNRMKDELTQLDKTYGDPIRMRYFEDRSYDEIAHRLGKPLGTIKSLIHRGKEILKDRMYANVATA
jgi:RNA polymerase sigma-70 factor (ECF subfamily)